jgi:NAD(P)-dependent dehydrogenase (short-subunit alcohol dehydrogenase family)
MSDSRVRSVLVTGASTGIGRDAAYALLREGYRVFAGVRNEAAAAQLRADAPAGTADRLETVELDVTSPDQVGDAVARVEAAVGERGLWGLFNNAGVSVYAPVEFLPLDELRRQLEVNVIGQVAVTQAFIPLLRRARGRILFTGSISGFFAAPLIVPYSMSKYAVESLTDALRRELRPWGIDVSLLQPGPIATEIWRKGLSEIDEVIRNAPPGMSELYGPLLRSMERVATESASRAAPVSLVTRDVVHAFTAKRPRTRYLIGPGARLRKVLTALPDRWADALLARALSWG